MTKKRPSRKQKAVPDVSLAKEEEQIKEHTLDILRAYHGERRNLIPILQDIQAKLGYLPREAIKQVAKSMRIKELEVFAVASFYNQFRLNPPGKHPIKVCMGTACHIKGGRIILEAWERRLGITVGETTSDREFDLERVACVGCCAMAPVTVVDERVEGKVSPTRVDGILLSFELEKEKGTDK
ncbi:MAG: NADH-quinone oxidoreductase subunit NuoE [Dehalococcoidia bacterium]|jgi:NADH-quinone oxidoreductase subunit E|nr:NADH-quinone oxidoreductase subunit NuoE [Chloroflexota bacterium]MCK4242430.1 NADH-quinone oxidoreductase subunit NuoE [Dehalococcoidia bacterium]